MITLITKKQANKNGAELQVTGSYTAIFCADLID